MGYVVFKGFLSFLTKEIFCFFTPFAFELPAVWGPPLPWSDLIIIPVCSNNCKEGGGVLMIWQRRFGHPLSTEFHLLAKKCIFDSSQGSSQVQNTSFTGLRTCGL